MNVDELLTRPEALYARVQAVLAAAGGPVRPLRPGIRRAAVLMPLVHARGEATLLLTERSQSVERHKGQISLPGGAVEPGESPLDAALRETSEEIGVRAENVTLLGALEEEETVVSGFVLTPYVGSIAYPYALRINRAEVTRVLEVPVRVLLDPLNVRAELWEHDGTARPVYFFSVNGDVVWGATARVIMQFLRTVFLAALPAPGRPPAPGRGS